MSWHSERHPTPPPPWNPVYAPGYSPIDVLDVDIEALGGAQQFWKLEKIEKIVNII